MAKQRELIYSDTKETLIFMGGTGMAIVVLSFVCLFPWGEQDVWSSVVLIVCDGFLFALFARLAWDGFRRKNYAVIDESGIHIWKESQQICSVFWSEMTTCGYLPRHGRFPPYLYVSRLSPSQTLLEIGNGRLPTDEAFDHYLMDNLLLELQNNKLLPEDFAEKKVYLFAMKEKDCEMVKQLMGSAFKRPVDG